MRNVDWRRLSVRFVLDVAVFVLLAWLLLWLSGRSLRVLQEGGDQSQSSAIDTSPVIDEPTLPTVDWPEVRNVVLIIADGMGFSQVMAARSEIRRLNERLFFERFPVTGWHATHSLDALYTDSAASASALATGRKVEYLTISMSPAGVPYSTILEAARDRGLATGAVTDSYLWDATPAAFLTHSASRRNLYDIGAQMAASGVDFLAGEASTHLDLDTVDEDVGGPPLRTLFRDAGFRIAESAGALAAVDPADPSPVLAFLPSGELADPELPPSLPEITTLALDKLSRDPDGYFLLVETEETDSGGHRAQLQRLVDGIRAVETIAAFAVERAFADQQTLVLITADHETGGMALLHGDEEHRMGVRWATTSHSAEPVPIYAFGAGAGRFAGVKDNTDVARILSELLDLDLFDRAP